VRFRSGHADRRGVCLKPMAWRRRARSEDRDEEVGHPPISEPSPLRSVHIEVSHNDDEQLVANGGPMRFDGRGGKGKGRGGRNGSTACFVCGEEGHKGRECPQAPPPEDDRVAGDKGGKGGKGKGKGKGKGEKGKGKGKGGKGKGKGKGKGRNGATWDEDDQPLDSGDGARQLGGTAAEEERETEDKEDEEVSVAGSAAQGDELAGGMELSDLIGDVDEDGTPNVVESNDSSFAEAGDRAVAAATATAPATANDTSADQDNSDNEDSDDGSDDDSSSSSSSSSNSSDDDSDVGEDSNATKAAPVTKAATASSGSDSSSSDSKSDSDSDSGSESGSGSGSDSDSGSDSGSGSGSKSEEAQLPQSASRGGSEKLGATPAPSGPESRKRACLSAPASESTPAARSHKSARLLPSSESGNGGGGSSAAAALNNTPGSRASLTSALGSGQPAPSVAGLDAIGGLPELMTNFSAATALRAVRWCEEEDADSVMVIVMAGRAEAFVDALGLKPGGCNEAVLRQRLAAMSAPAAAHA
jgi:hypothetical protein